MLTVILWTEDELQLCVGLMTDGNGDGGGTCEVMQAQVDVGSHVQLLS